MSPAALADVNGDQIKDIIIATFNSRVIAFDGFSFKPIWNTTFHNSESYASLAVGYYDEDKVPDVFVKYQYGDGYPEYEYEIVSVKIYST